MPLRLKRTSQREGGEGKKKENHTRRNRKEYEKCYSIVYTRSSMYSQSIQPSTVYKESGREGKCGQRDSQDWTGRGADRSSTAFAVVLVPRTRTAPPTITRGKPAREGAVQVECILYYYDYIVRLGFKVIVFP
jgi:hypothetical protein